MSVIAISATFTVEPVAETLEFLLQGLEMPYGIEFAPYNQVFQQLLDPQSLLGANREGVNVVLARLEDWAADAHAMERCGEDFLTALESAASRAQAAPHVVILCPASDAAHANHALAEGILRMEARIAKRAAAMKGIFVTTSAELLSAYPLPVWNDSVSDRHGRIPYTPAFFAALGSMIARRIFSIKHPPYKVAVLDCDQTIWRGVAGEDGPSGIVIDEPRRFLQEFMVEQTRAGMLLTLCSKNVEEDVFRVFRERDDMPLRESHLAGWRIDWNSKSENLRALAAELNLGLDSFVFIDDDPVVCAEARANCPEALTLQLPEEPAQIPAFLRNAWVFDRLRVTEEDAARTALYQQNREREKLRGSASNFREFLETLELQVTISPMAAANLPRVAQLTGRTNQFNFTTIRRSEAEIVNWLAGPHRECLTVEVRDRFGDYGLVGVILFTAGPEALAVDTLLLSCRALGRGVEHAMVAKLGGIAAGRGIPFVDLRFSPTAKNRPAALFLERIHGRGEQMPDGSTHFRFAADGLAGLALDAGSADEAESGTDEKPAPRRAPAAMQPAAANSFLEKIAREFHKPENILKALSAGTPRPSGGKRAFVAPKGPEETRLAAMWEDLLRTAPVGATDNYFELGGDSLIGVRLMTAIQHAFGQSLTLDTLLEAPTVADLAARLRRGSGGESYLTPIQAAGSAPPLYCMHAAGGNVMFYGDLAARLGPNQPVYGLRARRSSGETPCNRVEDMAARYIRDIVAFQPHGPYYLAGSSFGGLVAYEMARQLTEQGRAIALLALFDTYCPGYPQRLPGNRGFRGQVNKLLDRLQHHAVRLRTYDWSGRRRFVAEKGLKTVRLLGRLWKKGRNKIARNYYAATGQELPRELRQTTNAIEEAERCYAPQPYVGPMILFRAARQPRGIVPDLYLGWGGLAMGGITVHEVPGFHGAVTMEPYAGPLVQKLRPYLSAGRPSGAAETPAPASSLAAGRSVS